VHYKSLYDDDNDDDDDDDDATMSSAVSGYGLLH